MKKQPIDTHPADQFMQALDAKIQPVMNEFHWEGMQALLDENFPQSEEPNGGAAQSDSKPETGAGKAIKRFKWIFLGGIALIATLAGTQWNAMAIQNSGLKKEINIQGNESSLEESATSGIGRDVNETGEFKSNPETGIETNSGIGDIPIQESDFEETSSVLSTSQADQEQEGQDQIDTKLNQGAELALDSLSGKKQMEQVSDTVSVKKKKFIFW